MRCSSLMRIGPAALAGMLFGPLAVALAADAPSPKLALSFQPVQKKYLDYETPAGADVDKCQVKVERRGKASGWVVYGPQGRERVHEVLAW